MMIHNYNCGYFHKCHLFLITINIALWSILSIISSLVIIMDAIIISNNTNIKNKEIKAIRRWNDVNNQYLNHKLT